MKNELVVSLLSIFLIICCANPKKMMNNTSIDRIYFGKYGGFTNIPMEYVLFEKGQLYKMESDSLLKTSKISKKQINAIDSLLQEIDFQHFELNEPGNITYYIKVVKTGYEKEIKWTDTTVNEKLKKLYTTLLATIKK
jgi:hypothetical protein